MTVSLPLYTSSLYVVRTSIKQLDLNLHSPSIRLSPKQLESLSYRGTIELTSIRHYNVVSMSVRWCPLTSSRLSYIESSACTVSLLTLTSAFSTPSLSCNLSANCLSRALLSLARLSRSPSATIRSAVRCNICLLWVA